MRHRPFWLSMVVLALPAIGAAYSQDPRPADRPPARSDQEEAKPRTDEEGKSRGLGGLGSKLAGETHKLGSNGAKETHKLESNGAKETHKLESNDAKASHKLQSNTAKKVVQFNHWWNYEVMGTPRHRAIIVNIEQLYEFDRRHALTMLGWSSVQIRIFEKTYEPAASFNKTEYAALHDVLCGVSYGGLVQKLGRTKATPSDAAVNGLPDRARRRALAAWGHYYGIVTTPTNSLRLDDDDAVDTGDGNSVTGPGESNSSGPVGDQTNINFGWDSAPVITPGPGSGPSPITTGQDAGPGSGTTQSGQSAGGGGGGSVGGNGGGGGGGGNGSGVGNPAGGSTSSPSGGGTAGYDPRTPQYIQWAQQRFEGEYKGFKAKLTSQLNSLEQGAGNLYVRYGDKVKDFARDKVKDEVEKALKKLPGGNAATKAMGVFNDLMVAREELAAGPTLQKHPGAKLVTSFAESEKPDKFLEGVFSGPTDIRAIALSRQGYTVWKSGTGEWFADRNPALSPSEYETVIRPNGNPTPGTASPVSIPDKAILIHYLQKVAKEHLKHP